jgi:hypothetical protein
VAKIPKRTPEERERVRRNLERLYRIGELRLAEDEARARAAKADAEEKTD